MPLTIRRYRFIEFDYHFHLAAPLRRHFIRHARYLVSFDILIISLYLSFLHRALCRYAPLYSPRDYHIAYAFADRLPCRDFDVSSYLLLSACVLSSLRRFTLVWLSFPRCAVAADAAAAAMSLFRACWYIIAAWKISAAIDALILMRSYAAWLSCLLDWCA